MAMIIGAGIVIWRTIRTERARSRKRWEARTGGVGTYDGGGGDCSGGIDSGGFG